MKEYKKEYNREEGIKKKINLNKDILEKYKIRNIRDKIIWTLFHIFVCTITPSIGDVSI